MHAKTIRGLVLLAALSLFCTTVAWAVDHSAAPRRLSDVCPRWLVETGLLGCGSGPDRTGLRTLSHNNRENTGNSAKSGRLASALHRRKDRPLGTYRANSLLHLTGNCSTFIRE